MPPEPKLKGTVTLELLNVYGDYLAEPVDINARHQVLSDTRVFRAVKASKAIKVTGLRATPQGLYRLEIDPPSYLPVSVFAIATEKVGPAMTLAFVFDPKKIQQVTFPSFENLPQELVRLLSASKAVLGAPDRSGKELFESLDDIRRAGLLNVLVKCIATPLPNGKTVASYLTEVLEVRGDRIFVSTPRALREDVKSCIANDLFTQVPEALHTPPPMFHHAGSFKTKDRYGNLQLTFFANDSEWRADIDIDDANGLEHVFQVVRNAVLDRPTSPYDIHQILLQHQKLDTGMRILV